MVASPNMIPMSGQGSLSSAPQFVTSTTSKAKYRECLRRWTSSLNGLAKSDPEEKGILESAGNVIILACDDIAQNVFSQAERAGIVYLDVGQNDLTREKSIEAVIEILAKDRPTERLTKEL